MNGRSLLLGLLGGLVLSHAAASASAGDPNNITGSRGVILIDKVGERVRFLAPGTLKEISSITVGVKPHEVAISPDRRTAYVTIYGDGIYGDNPHPGRTIAVIDIAAKKQIDTIEVSPQVAPHSIMIDRKGTLYVTCDESRRLLIINPKTKRIEASIDTEGTGHFFAVTPDGAKAYVANKSDRPYVSVIDTRARKIVARIPTPSGTEGVSISPDGKRVAIADHSSQILIVDTATDAIVKTVKLDGGLARGALRTRYSPDGKYLLTSGTGAQANLFRVADLSKQTVLVVGRNAMGTAFGPDGKTAFVANHGEGTISVVDLESARVTSKFTAGGGIENIAFY